MKLLFITHPYPNYVPDLLLHGLRKLLGNDVIDFPKKDCLYNGVLGLGVCPEDQLSPGWFPPDNGQMDRDDIWQRVNTGFFDCIISDYRAFALLLENVGEWPKRLVLIDGEDSPINIPAGNYVICRRETDGSDFSIPLPMALPEEIFHWISNYDDQPKKYSVGFLGSTHDGERKHIADTLKKYYPDALLKTSAVPSGDNQKPDDRFSRDEYYRMLQQCRMVLSLSGAGHDTFRFWENAACNAVHISARFPLYIPHDFADHSHILRFSTLSELRKHIDSVLENQSGGAEMVQNARYHLIKHHMTTERARYFLDRIKGSYR